jgi:tetratricopeptide (TPR) repeat protein
MKKSLMAFFILCGGIVGALVYLNNQKPAPPVPSPVVDSTPSQPTANEMEKMSGPKTETPSPAAVETAPTQVATSNPMVANVKPDDSTNLIHKLVADLLAAKNGAQKHELLQQLIKSGQMDAAIAELKQRAGDNSNDPEIPTTLGEAQLNQAGAIHAAGGDVNEQGILAMQADQSFNAALKIDPQNFEAQLLKSIAMSYWPADPARDAQVVQTFSSLIDRQENMPSQPDFAQAYIYLGNEYQKIGQSEQAQATWQLGLQKFPDNQTLQAKLNGQ